MSITQTAEALVEKFNKRTQHLTPLLRDARRSGYSEGVRDLMNALASQAADETIKQELRNEIPKQTT